MSQYANRTPIPLAVDCIIFGFHDNQLELLSVPRNVEPYQGMRALMGGFVQLDEDIDAAAKRVLTELTGLSDVYMEQVGAFGNVARDSAERVVSIAYYALIRKDTYDETQVESHEAQWYHLEDLPELVFDHKDMIEHALRRLRRKVKTEPIGFNLLPNKFTQAQIQNLYEAILNEQLDKRNFRKKLLSLDVLVKLDEKDKLTSKKGSFLYTFDQEKYEQKLGQGFSFKL